MTKKIALPRATRPAAALAAFAMACFAGFAGFAGSAQAASVLDEWDKIALPAKPQAVPVAVDKTSTALLVLDMQPQTCNEQRRPRCLPTKAAVAALVKKARAAGAPVVYSLIRNSSPADIFPELGYKEGDPYVAASVDKFLGTDLAAILAAKGIKTVIVTGTAAHGAVLHTATGAAQRGLSIIVPADAISAEDAFTEAAVLWCLTTGPASKDKVTVSSAGKIGF
ncbi:MAG: cysteine hydrolase [Desulfovibrionaceae bacterium]|nr:cysteine hydrolase [Desulfovibrionaceae bacterium]MBF0513464.1 cysteine hydrolase [Desulfovibrionaceae bacterium]